MRIKFLTVFAIVAAAIGSAWANDYTDGIEYFKADQPDNARTILERTINDPSTNKSEAYYYLGEIAFQNKDYTKAAEYYAKGLEADPENAYNLVGQGKLQLTTDKKAAEKLFKEALKKNKKTPV